MIRRFTAIVLLTGCGAQTPNPIMLPAPKSHPPVITHEFKAGFAKVEITPPPGMGLSGNAFEGQQARGYGQRLYARVMLLEAVDGERIAYVVTDIPHISALLQRLTAERTRRGPSEIGADRLVLATTHTHSSVANHYTNSSYNRQSGPLPGYDAVWVDFLVKRLARAVDDAYADLKPARAAWSFSEVTNVTENRSPAPFMNNPMQFGGMVDDTLYMLRADHCGGTPVICTPRGVFSVFAIHGTGFPTTGDLMDPDIHGVVQRTVERAIDAGNGVPRPDTLFRPVGVHVLANGTEGDVAPRYGSDTRCERQLRQRPGSRPAGPRWSPPPPEVWRAPQSGLDACMSRARDSVATLAGRLGAVAVSQFNDNVPGAGALTIQRAFITVHLPTYPNSPAICPEARFGTANVGGAPNDGRTRLLGWSVLGFIPTGFEPGPRSVADPPHPCQGEKRIGLGFFGQGLAVGEHGLPEYAQFSVVRIGDVAVVSVPWEVTTVAGRLIKRAVKRHAPWAQTVVVIGLANGYFQYLTTAEEYALQYYEGGSNLYGRNTLDLVITVVEDLTANLGSTASVVSFEAHPGARQSHFRVPPALPTAITREFTGITCIDRVLEAEWVDAPPGQFQPSDRQVLRITDNGVLIGWDDRPDVDVRAVRSLNGGRFLWRVTFRSQHDLTSDHVVHLLPLPGEIAGPSTSCP